MRHLIYLWSLLIVNLSVSAEVVVDGSLGIGHDLTGPQYAITENLGQRQDGNLFHSFSRFNLLANETATFSGEASIQNVIGRVTGGELSQIDGTIASTIPQADVYLINPAGLVFGKNAQLDVPAGFYAGSADAVHLQDGGVFHADIQKNSLLTTAPPGAFGFLQTNPAAVELQEAKLTVNPGQSLTLAGPLSLQKSSLRGQGGKLHLASVGGIGQVDLLNSQMAASAAPLTVVDSVISSTDRRGIGQGHIFIQAGKFFLQNSTVSNENYTQATGGNIDIVAEAITLKGSAISTITRSTGEGGHISLQADSDIFLQADDQNPSRISASTTNQGEGGKIVLSGKRLHLSGDSQLVAITVHQGNAGEITAEIDNEVQIEAGGIYLISELARAENLGNAGNLKIMTDNLVLKAGAKILSNTTEKGQGGQIHIVADNISLAGHTSDDTVSSIESSAAGTSAQAGDGGEIILAANNLFIRDGGQIVSATRGGGKGGMIRIQATENVTFQGRSGEFASGVYVLATETALAEAGQIQLEVGGKLRLQDQAVISASSAGQGQGGNIHITAEDVQLNQQSLITAKSFGIGDAGDIHLDITGDNLELYDGSQIITQAREADGGNMTLFMPSYLYLDQSEISTSVGSGQGGGGNIRLEPEFIILDNSKILAQAYGGPGGNIDIVTTGIYNLSDEPIEMVINASSQLGVDGVITIASPDENAEEKVIILSSNFLQADKLLRDLCAVRQTDNRFIVLPAESYPNLPEDWLPSHSEMLILQRCE